MGSLRTLAYVGAAAVVAASATLATPSRAADFSHAPAPLLAPPPPPPMVSDGGLYLRGDIGVGLLTYDSLDVRQNGLPVVQPGGATSYSTLAARNAHSVFAGAGVGYKFNSFFRVDATGEFRGTTLEGRDNVQFPIGGLNTIRQTNSYRGNLATIVGMFNAYVDLGTWNCITPFVGVGLGFANHALSITDNGAQDFYTAGVYQSSGTSFGYADQVKKTNFAWALMAGVAYDVNPNLKLELGYRYINMGDSPVMRLAGGSGVLSNPSSTVGFKKLQSHDIKIGMRWMFADPNCCNSAPAPQLASVPMPAPLMPAPRPITRKY